MSPLLLLVLLSLSVAAASDYNAKWCNPSSDELQGCLPARRGSVCHCVFNENRDVARCCHVDLRRLRDEVIGCDQKPLALRALLLSNCTADQDELNLVHLAQSFPNLTSLSLTDGGYTKVRRDDPSAWNNLFPTLHCLNLSHNAIVQREDIAEVIDLVPALRVVDLSHNNLTYSPALKDRTQTLWLHIAANSELKCDGIREAMLKSTPIDFLYKNLTKCISRSSFEWFNSTDPITLKQIEARHKIKDCPPRCTCATERLVFVDDTTNEAHYSVNVDCSHQQLVALPTRLPFYTFTLNASNNNITNLEQLICKDCNYEQVRVLDLDHNEISSIQILEGSHFLQNFESLSLRSNKLRTLTTHMLNNAFSKNWNTAHIRLGNNYFYCSDCNTFKSIKDWLNKHKKHIVDDEEIYCQEFQEKVLLQLNDADICINQEEWNGYIYYVIAAEVLLLLLLIGKVSYDYWVFKTVGYLPWPASKMPKLPCDCVLEM